MVGDENIRIQGKPILLPAIIILFMGLVPTVLSMPRLIFRIPPVRFLLCPDVNGDGLVNLEDLLIVGKGFGASQGSANWIPEADVNNDGIINIFDVVQIATVAGSAV